MSFRHWTKRAYLWSALLGTSILACSAAFAANPQTFIDAAGIYPLISHGAAPTASQVTSSLSNSHTAGISIRTEWWTIEPEEDEYDWSYIDDFIDKADTYGKKIMIRVRPAWQTPDWVYDAGAEEFWYYEKNDGDNLHRMPVPWDEVFLEKWADFVADFGARYNEHETVAHILITGASRSDCEMYLPPNSVRDTSQQDTWETIGYTPAVITSAWEEVIDMFVEAFPDKLLSLSLSTILYNDGSLEDVAEYCSENYPWHVAHKVSFWHNSNSPTYYPLVAMTSRVDEFTHGGVEAVGSIGSGSQADFEDAVEDAIGWDAVFWMEPYPGNQLSWLSDYYDENLKHKQMVASTTFDAEDGDDGQSQLTWDNPSGYTGFSEVKVMRKTGSFPAGTGDGAATTVYQGTNESYLDTGLTNGTTYYYAMYELPSGYTIAQDTATPVTDTTPPSDVSNFTATAGDEEISLSWDNPADADFDGVRIQRSTAGFPATPASGTNVYDGAGESHLDTGLTNNTAYYYTAFAYDGVPNYADGVGAGATPESSQSGITFDNSAGSEDGWVLESTESSGVGGTVQTGWTGASGIIAGDNNQDKQYKGVLSFDTSSLPDGATIVSATLRLKRGTVSGTNPFTTHGTCYVDVRTGGFNGNTALETADFAASASVSQAATMSNAAADGDWSEGALNSSGRGAINKTGTTQFRVYFSTDDNDDSGNDYIGWYPGENATQANRPQLVILYEE